MEKIIRIDKGDGKETEVDSRVLRRAIENSYRDVDLALRAFYDQRRINTQFAEFELREDK